MRELEVVGGKAAALVAGVVRRYGLSHAALNALAVIEGTGGPVPAGVVSARMHITTGTMTTVLDTLERNGLVVRRADPDDRRRVLVDITPAAQDLLDRMLPEVQQVARLVMGALDDQALETLLENLATVSAAIEAMPDDVPLPAPRRRPLTSAGGEGDPPLAAPAGYARTGAGMPRGRSENANSALTSQHVLSLESPRVEST